MNKNAWAIAAVAMVLIGGTALVLANRDRFQKLGEPGVKIVPVPSYDSAGGVVNPESVYLPETVLNYGSTNRPIDDVVLGWLPSDTTYGQRLYIDPDGIGIQLNVVLMGTDRTSIHKPQFCLTGVGWNITDTTYTSIPMTRPHAYDLPVIRMQAEQLVTLADGRRLQMSGIYVYWFVADGVVTSEHNARMIGILKDLPNGVLQRWAYVSTFSVCMPGQEDETYGRMVEFIAEAVPTFQLASGPEKVAGL